MYLKAYSDVYSSETVLGKRREEGERGCASRQCFPLWAALTNESRLFNLRLPLSSASQQQSASRATTGTAWSGIRPLKVCIMQCKIRFWV